MRYDLMTAIGPLPSFHTALLLHSHQFCQLTICKDGRNPFVLTETKSASLVAAVSSPGCRYQPHKVYFAATGKKNQNAAAKGLVQAGAEHPVWSIWSLLLGLCALHCPLDHLAFCPHSPGSAHAKLLPVPQHLAPGGCYHVQKGRRRQNKHSQESHNIAAALPGNRL